MSNFADALVRWGSCLTVFFYFWKHARCYQCSVNKENLDSHSGYALFQRHSQSLHIFKVCCLMTLFQLLCSNLSMTASITMTSVAYCSFFVWKKPCFWRHEDSSIFFFFFSCIKDKKYKSISCYISLSLGSWVAVSLCKMSELLRNSPSLDEGKVIH